MSFLLARNGKHSSVRRHIAIVKVRSINIVHCSTASNESCFLCPNSLMIIRSISTQPILGLIPKLNHWSKACIHEPPLLNKHAKFLSESKHALHRELVTRHENQLFSPHPTHVFSDSASNFPNDIFQLNVGVINKNHQTGIERPRYAAWKDIAATIWAIFRSNSVDFSIIERTGVFPMHITGLDLPAARARVGWSVVVRCYFFTVPQCSLFCAISS